MPPTPPPGREGHDSSVTRRVGSGGDSLRGVIERVADRSGAGRRTQEAGSTPWQQGSRHRSTSSRRRSASRCIEQTCLAEHGVAVAGSRARLDTRWTRPAEESLWSSVARSSISQSEFCVQAESRRGGRRRCRSGRRLSWPIRRACKRCRHGSGAEVGQAFMIGSVQLGGRRRQRTALDRGGQERHPTDFPQEARAQRNVTQPGAGPFRRCTAGRRCGCHRPEAPGTD